MNLATRLCSVALAAALVAAAPRPAGADDIRTTARAVAARSQGAVVTVKLVVKMRVMGQEEEQKLEVTGTVIDPGGLTVVSATEIDPSTMIKAVLGPMMRARGGGNMHFDSDVKETLLILDDGTEIEADVVLKDADLDLAFIRPRDASRKFEAIELKPRGKAPQLLEEVFVLSRLGRLENRSTALTLGAVRAVVKGPRTFYICDSETSQAGLGCVAFAADGSPIGVFVTKQNPAAHESNAGMGMLVGMLTGGKRGAAAIAILRSVDDVIEIATQAKQAKVPEKKPEAAPEKGEGEAEKEGAGEEGEGEGAPKPDEPGEAHGDSHPAPQKPPAPKSDAPKSDAPAGGEKK